MHLHLLGARQDTQTMLRAFSDLWSQRPERLPYAVSVTLHDLAPKSSVSLPLFPEDQKRLKVAQTMDAINTRFGLHTIYLADMHNTEQAAPMRISFTHVPDITIEQERR